MCIICVSQKGIKQPTFDQIKTMFTNNPDGAGYMVARAGRVEIHKGFMILDDLLHQLEREAFTPDDPVVYHFRISTQGGVNPEMTHPFPLSWKPSELKALDLHCKVGIVHNGIIKITACKSEYSDTALFIGHYLTRLIRKESDIDDPWILNMVDELIKSKMAIMNSSGTIQRVGDFTSVDGILFSNDSYKPRKFTLEPVKKTFYDPILPWYDVI